MTTDTPVGATPHRAASSSLSPAGCCAYHRADYSPDQALAYVADRRGAASPSERALAGEVLRLRAVVDELGDSLAELRERTTETVRRVSAVAEAWGQVGADQRFAVQRAAGATLVARLDRLVYLAGVCADHGVSADAEANDLALVALLGKGV